jgi:hypothetical protein
MGKIISNLVPCFCKNRFNTPKIDEESLDDDSIKLKERTKIEFYCPKCEVNEEISEILKIYSDNGKMKIKCPKQNKEFDYSFEDYCDKINKKTEHRCNRCKKHSESEPTHFCLGCSEYFCSNCMSDHTNKFPDKSNIFVKLLKKFHFLNCLTNSCINTDEHRPIKINEITSYCLKHKIETTECCRECRKNVCGECSKEYHKWHKIKDINYYDIMNARDIIYQKGNKLLKMKEFYDMIRAAYEKNKTDPYKENLANVSNFIEKEKKREVSNIDLAFYRIEQINNGIERKEDNNINNK